MLDLLIRSSFSMLVFLAVYHVFLEREKMHVFNRFYLIGTLFFSLCVPLVSLDLIGANYYAGQIFSGRLQPMQIKATGRENFEWIGLIYSVGLLLFFVRFVKNISGIYRRIRRNRHIEFEGAILVVTFTATLKKVAVFPVIAVVALISCEKAKPIEKEGEVEIRFANYYEDKDSAFAKKPIDLTAEVVTENDGHFKNPEFPGGIPELQNYLVKNLSEISGKDAKVVVRFIVEKDGSVADVKVAKYKGPGVDKIKEVLLNSPKWTAAIYNGEAVPFLYTLPIQM